MDGAAEIAGLGKVFGSAEQHSGVAVMAAGVHLAGNGGAERQVRHLLHRQRIHVGAQAEGTVAGAVAQRADDAGLADLASDVQAPGFELARDDVGGAVFLKAEFGMSMEVMTNGLQLGLVTADRVDDRHAGQIGAVAGTGRLEQVNTSVPGGEVSGLKPAGHISCARLLQDSLVSNKPPQST